MMWLTFHLSAQGGEGCRRHIEGKKYCDNVKGLERQ